MCNVKLIASSLLALLCLFPNDLSAQDQKTVGPSGFSQLEKAVVLGLRETGFQNLSAKVSDQRLWINFENRVYRFLPKALEQVSAILNEVPLEGIEEVVLVIRKRGIPINTIRWVVDNLEKSGSSGLSQQSAVVQEVSRAVNQLDPEVRKSALANSGQYRVEIEIEPEVKLGLGGFPDPVVHQINLLPAANIYLWKGSRLRLQGVVPISDEFNFADEQMVRPGLLTFNQVFRLPFNAFSSLTVGYFTEYNYGFNGTLGKFFLNGDLLIRAKAGFTGYASYPRRIGYDRPLKGWQFSDIDYWDYSGAVSYRYNPFDLIIDIEFGRFLIYKDAVRIGVTRQFNEMDLGFYAVKMREGSNYGFRISVPLFPAKYFKPRRFQIKPSSYFQYTYQATQNYLPNYRTGEHFDDFFHHLAPGFINNQLTKNKHRD